MAATSFSPSTARPLSSPAPTTTFGKMGDTKLAAFYASPSSEHTFSSPLPAPKTDNVQVKTAYLSKLRTSIVQLQSDVNAFLTAKMEEDKANQTDSKRAQDEQKAEEMYGEEDPGEEES